MGGCWLFTLRGGSGPLEWSLESLKLGSHCCFFWCFRLEQRWVEVSIDTQIDALIDAVNQGVKFNSVASDARISRTMVFANTVDAVESIAKILKTAGIKCFSYHRNTSLEEPTKNLFDFKESGGVLVCTDAAARGLDIPKVSHVIQVFVITNIVICKYKSEIQ